MDREALCYNFFDHLSEGPQLKGTTPSEAADGRRSQ